MNNENAIHKSLSKITRDEKGWRKSLATADGSYSREFAEENLRRLQIEQGLLHKRLESLQMRRQHVMRVATGDGIVTDHVRDGVCEQLVIEGWLVGAETLPRRAGRRVDRVYLPTDKAVEGWHSADTEQPQQSSG